MSQCRGITPCHTPCLTRVAPWNAALHLLQRLGGMVCLVTPRGATWVLGSPVGAVTHLQSSVSPYPPTVEEPPPQNHVPTGCVSPWDGGKCPHPPVRWSPLCPTGGEMTPVGMSHQGRCDRTRDCHPCPSRLACPQGGGQCRLLGGPRPSSPHQATPWHGPLHCDPHCPPQHPPRWPHPSPVLSLGGSQHGLWVSC